MNIFEHIEFTQLDPATTERDIIDLCLMAKEQYVHSVCINSAYVALANELLNDSDIKICSVIGFPFGATDTASKIHEAKSAIANGATEIDMVLNLGLLKSKNYVSVLKDISDVKIAIGNIPLKVILEISELNKNEIIKACQICLDAKVDFIKTSTGFSKGGATLTVVKIIKKTIRNNIKICAFHGIEDEEAAIKYIELGADRIGVSRQFKTNSMAA
ncbi:deoxyribose-phosphate aldolase [Seonamhaeicola maritimus]|uniref:deoxyribose-phosphate aldolase n=1 Tax=Seonamhaeicola maritimus TaxID=2591822 RepID=UPI002493E3AF|nr:deoxyribose-phosphate aldolase [Seonamhaeicola maritimus]